MFSNLTQIYHITQFLRNRIKTQTKWSQNGLEFNIKYSNTMTTPNINLYVVLFYLGTQTLCGRNEHPKQDAYLTFYIPVLNTGPNDLQMTSNSIFLFWYVDFCIKRKWYKEYNGHTQDLQCEQKRNQQWLQASQITKQKLRPTRYARGTKTTS